MFKSAQMFFVFFLSSTIDCCSSILAEVNSFNIGSISIDHLQPINTSVKKKEYRLDQIDIDK